MKRNIRKVVSIICVIAVLMSLCVVSVVNTTSAYKASDAPAGTELLHDFEDKTGISDGYNRNPETIYVADPADPTNTVVKLFGNTMAGINVEIGNEGCTTLDGTDAYILKPNTAYRITFKYKFGAGSYNKNNVMNLQLYAGVQSAYSSSVLGKQSIAATESFVVKATENPETTNVGTGSDAQTVNILANDTEWMTFTYDYTTGAEVTRDNLYINMPVDPQTEPYGKRTAYIDDIMIDIIDEEELYFNYNYNFKKDSTGAFWNADNHFVFSNTSDAYGNKSYVDAAGAHYTVNNGNVPTANDTAMWRHKMYIYDEDNGGYLKLQAGYTYMFTMNYKVEALQSTTAYIGLGHTVAKTAPTTSQTLKFIEGAWAAHGEVNMDDTQTMTVTFTCPDNYDGTHAAVIATSAGGTLYDTFLIESINVIIIPDTSKVALVSYEVNGGDELDDAFFATGVPSSKLPTPTHSDPDMGFAGWYLDEELTTPVGETLAAGNYTVYAKWTSDYVYVTFNNSGELSTSKLAKGTPLSNPTRPNSKMFFAGWYTDLSYSERVTVAPEVNCTLYAKYNYTYIRFDNGGISDKSQANSGIVTDPDDANNKVAKLFTAKGGSNNIEFGAYDAADVGAYKLLKTNTTYYIEFKIKLPAGVRKGGISVMTGGQSKYSPDFSKSGTGISFNWNTQSEDANNGWTTVSGYYTTGDTFYRERVNFTVQDQLYINLGINDGVSNSHDGFVYIDDVFVGEYTDEIPEGAVGIFYETNGSKVPHAIGYPGESVVLPEEPTLGGHKFVGWYTDMSLQTPYTATTFPDETITVYAKWKLVDATYTYDGFQTTSMSERYNYITEGGNAMLEYNYKQAPTSGPTGPARAVINDGVQYQVTNGNKYTIRVKYKVVEVTQGGVISAATHNSWSTWGDTNNQNGSIPYNGKTDGWVVSEFSFTANCKSDYATYLSLTVSGDSKLYIDELTISSTGGTTANIYGSSVIRFDTLGGPELDPISGNPGDAIVIPKIARKGFKFGGWYTEASLTNKFTDKTYADSDEPIVLYAAWILGKISESYEDFPSNAQMGVSSAYEIYEEGNTDITYDKANVYAGKTSVFRNGTKSGTKGFTLCRDSSLTLGVGERYTLTFWVKPSNVTDTAGVINLVQMSSNTSISAPDSVEVISDLGTLTVGEWQKVTYTFTATEQFIGISTTAGNDIYFDDFNITLKGYTGTTTGDNTVSPIIVMMVVLLAAGAMMVTAKKVFSK